MRCLQQNTGPRSSHAHCTAFVAAVTVQTRQPKAYFGARTFAWRAATSHLSDLPSGLTHVSKGVYARIIDRCCVSLPSCLLLASTDAGGQMCLNTSFNVHDGLPQWALHHPDFPNLLELHKVMHGIRTRNLIAWYPPSCTAYSGDEHLMLSLARQAPYWKLDVTMTLADSIIRASRLLEKARKDAEVVDSTSVDLDSAQHHKTF
eukprot:4290549-Amphidinium_carterae.2